MTTFVPLLNFSVGGLKGCVAKLKRLLLNKIEEYAIIIVHQCYIIKRLSWCMPTVA